ncbi:MAG TPA: serine/threonine-protein kinase [Thermoanaerobaculia bacterium]|nr:serine/threonine-protein kinase [Thermoanaerobaculia bacterium]
MTPSEWSRVKEILSGALECAPEERSSYLEGACVGDPELRRHVDALIAADEQTWGFLEAPAVVSSPLVPFRGEPAPGERIGVYEILREIGHGGMGVVYLARRADEQFEKKVAIKLARAGFGGDWLERRFRAERQIVANLDHPNIARLLDGGATSEGRAYLVMEYVEGEPLGQWCDSRGLDTRRRLEVFLDVCSAVAYAHQHLVVHRDLKPANILVTSDGSVKLLDFGIAKLVAPEAAADPADRTGTLFRAFTPDYASPEQIRGEPISTASDVYALGIVLYELLTGSKPYRVTDLSPVELIQTICEKEPPKASSVTKPPVSKGLAGDLDTIIATSLRKESGRRYPSVGAFADDIRRHLAGHPVQARADTPGYRAGKFARRHRAAVAASALIVLSLAGGLIMTLAQARRAREAEARAEKRFNDVRKLANVFLFEVHDQIRDLPGSTAARQTLVKRALEYLDSLSRERERDVSLTVELAAAYQRIGDVQGNPFQPNLGDSRGAAASYRRAIELLLPVANSGGAAEKDALARAFFSLGGLELALGDPPAAVRNSHQGLELRREVWSAAPSDLERGKALATGLRFHAFSLTATRRNEEALNLLAEEAALIRRLLTSAPQDVQLRHELAQNRYVTGTTLSRKGDDAGARAALNESVELWRALIAGNSSSPELRRGLFWALTDSALLLARPEELRAGLERFREAHEVAESLAASDPKNSDARVTLAISEINLGARSHTLRESGPAQEHWSRARALLEPLIAADPSNNWLGSILGELYASMAEGLSIGAANPDRRKGACDLYRKGFDTLSRLQAAGRLIGDRTAALEKSRAGLAGCGQTSPISPSREAQVDSSGAGTNSATAKR